VEFTHLHALGRNAPFGALKIELAPLCAAQFARANEHVGREA
jgi:hypothetical protein